jgi:hypothetical protein
VSNKHALSHTNVVQKSNKRSHSHSLLAGSVLWYSWFGIVLLLVFHMLSVVADGESEQTYVATYVQSMFRMTVQTVGQKTKNTSTSL